MTDGGWRMSLWRYRVMTWLGGRLRRAGQWLLDEAEIDPPRQEVERLKRLVDESGTRTCGPSAWACQRQHLQIQGSFTGPPTCAFCGTVMRPVPNATITVT